MSDLDMRLSNDKATHDNMSGRDAIKPIKANIGRYPFRNAAESLDKTPLIHNIPGILARDSRFANACTKVTGIDQRIAPRPSSKFAMASRLELQALSICAFFHTISRGSGAIWTPSTAASCVIGDRTAQVTVTRSVNVTKPLEVCVLPTIVSTTVSNGRLRFDKPPKIKSHPSLLIRNNRRLRTLMLSSDTTVNASQSSKAGFRKPNDPIH
mmetsp:Transcript_7291/g.8311  ORF Transcript_7291/g.8311 Transcript_7291/m.8311 type:complete len:211 (-) Transcript_7291:192-824(-)